MSEYRVAHLDEIGEISDGREPWRPVRHHFGITSFGVDIWTGRKAGDRIINEHDEEGEDEELYFVSSGRARFELDGERVDAPAGTFVFVRPGVKRTAFAEEPGTTILAVGGTPGKAYEPRGWESGHRSAACTRRGGTPRRPTRLATWSQLTRSTPGCSTTSPVARASPAGRATRSGSCDSRSKGRTALARTWRKTQTSTLFRDEPEFQALLTG